MKWTTPKYKKSEVDKAGVILKKESVTADELNAALDIMNNWRSAL